MLSDPICILLMGMHVNMLMNNSYTSIAGNFILHQNVRDKDPFFFSREQKNFIKFPFPASNVALLSNLALCLCTKSVMGKEGVGGGKQFSSTLLFIFKRHLVKT